MRKKSFNFDPIWHVEVAVLVALSLQLVLPDKFLAGPRFILPMLEILLVFLLYVTSKRVHLARSFHFLRKLNSVFLIGLIGITNAYALQSLAQELLAGGRVDDGRSLIISAINIFITNIIVFGLLYWELDGGGPHKRLKTSFRDRDFSFPQMQNPELAPDGWMPNFIDYVYVSATNAAAFSPTDTMPLTGRVKFFMLTQSLISLTTLGLVASRAINILN